MNRRQPSTVPKPTSMASASLVRRASFKDVLAHMLLHDAWRLMLTFALIFGGCCANVWFLEVITTELPKSGVTVTFFQFAATAAVALFHNLDFGSTSWFPTFRPNQVPLMNWLAVVAMFFGSSVLNNVALNFRISVPLHLVFRSGGLIVNLMMGFFIYGKRYSAMQIASVVIVTGGVILTTLWSANAVKANSDDDSSLYEWLIGIFILTVALFLQSFQGLYQEHIYTRFGKADWREGLFFIHALGLPFFMYDYKHIVNQIATINDSRPVQLLQEGSLPSVPYLWIMFVMNCVTQYFCIRGVHQLSSITTSLTVNMVLNVRKFVSLILSVIYFGNAFGLVQIIGTLFVFAGSVMYSMSSKPVAAAATAATSTKEKSKDE